MIGDIMYELPLFGEWRVVRAADALLTATQGREAPLGNTHGRGGASGEHAAEHPRVLDVFSSPQPFSEKNMGKCYVSMYSIPTGERCPDVSRT